MAGGGANGMASGTAAGRAMAGRAGRAGVRRDASAAASMAVAGGGAGPVSVISGTWARAELLGATPMVAAGAVPIVDMGEKE